MGIGPLCRGHPRDFVPALEALNHLLPVGLGCVANFHLSRLRVCSPAVTHGAQRGRATRAISFKESVCFWGEPLEVWAHVQYAAPME